jgi:hypothetical protein
MTAAGHETILLKTSLVGWGRFLTGQAAMFKKMAIAVFAPPMAEIAI